MVPFGGSQRHPEPYSYFYLKRERNFAKLPKGLNLKVQWFRVSPPRFGLLGSPVAPVR